MEHDQLNHIDMPPPVRRQKEFFAKTNLRPILRKTEISLAILCAATASSAAMEQSHVANGSVIVDEDLVLTMENRTSALYAGYNKDLTIDVKSLTVKPDWANLQQTGNLYGIMRVTGGNDVVITTNEGVDLALTLSPDASLENNGITTVGGLLMEASQSAKQPGTLVLDGGSGAINVCVKDGFKKLDTFHHAYGAKIEGASTVYLSGSAVNFSVKAHSSATAFLLDDKDRGFETLPTAVIASEGEANFIAHSKGAAATGFSADGYDVSLSGNGILFEAVSVEKEATALRIVEGKADFVKIPESEADAVTLTANAKTTATALEATSSDLLFNTGAFSVTSESGSAANGFKVEGGSVKVLSDTIVFDVSSSGNGQVNGISAQKDAEVSLFADKDIFLESSGEGGLVYGLHAGDSSSTGSISLEANRGSIVLSIEKGASSSGGVNAAVAYAQGEGSDISLSAAGNILADKYAETSETGNSSTYDIDGFRAQDGALVELNAGGYIALNPSTGLVGNDSAFRAQASSGDVSSILVSACGTDVNGYGVFAVSKGAVGRGAYAQNGEIRIDAHSGSILLSGSGGDARGIEVTGAGTDSVVTLNAADSIFLVSETDGSNAAGWSIGLYAVDSSTKSQAHLTAKETVSISSVSKNNYAFGVNTQGAGALARLSGKNVHVDAKVSDKPSSAYALYAVSGHMDIDSSESTLITSTGTGAYVTSYNGSVGLIEIDAEQDAVIQAEKAAANAKGGEIFITAGQDAKLISATNSGAYATGSGNVVTVSAGRDALVSAVTGTYVQKDGRVELSAGNDVCVTTSGYGAFADNGVISYDAEKNAVVYSETASALYAGGTGIISLLAKETAQLTGSKEVVYAGSGGRITMGVDGDGKTVNGSNLIFAGTVDEAGFGSETALLSVSQSGVLLAAKTGNFVHGAAVARGGVKTGDKATTLELRGDVNSVQSVAVIKDAGDLQTEDAFKDKVVIGALYAEGADASIRLTGRNELKTLADPENESQLERVVWAYDSADITLEGWTSISTDSYEKSPNSLDVAVAAGTAVNLDADTVKKPVADRATVSILYDRYEVDGKEVKSSITGDVLAAYAGQVDIAPKEGGTAGIDITGNLLAGNNGVLNVNLGEGGTLTGRADDYGDAGVVSNEGHSTSEFFDEAFSSAIYKGGEVNLTMGSKSRWNVTGQSWVTRIHASDAPIGDDTPVIDLISANTDRNEAAHALTVYELRGNAVVNMSLDADRDVSDMLYIKNAQGEYLINVIDPVSRQDMYADGFDGLRFATVGAGSNLTFRAITYDQGVNNVEYKVETDAYDGHKDNDRYNGTEVTEGKPGSDLVDEFFGNNGKPGTEDSTEDGAATVTSNASDESGTDAPDVTHVEETTNFKLVGRVGESTSDAGKTVINMSRANYAQAVYLDTLNKRQGEMRFQEGKEDGLWARVRYDRIGKKGSFELDNAMMEVGVDSLYRKETGELHTGVAFDTMKGDADYLGVKGDGNVDRYGAWWYTTWLGDDNEYWDFVFKFGHLENDFTVYAPTTGEKVKGDYDNNVFSLSLEYGKKFVNEKSWYVEPQAQVQYAYVTSAEYQTSQETNVRLDAIHSVIARAGLRVGKDFTNENPATVYVRGDVMHEFLGDQDIRAADATGTLRERYENKGTWYSAGAGVTYKTSKDIHLFVEAEKVFGNSNRGSYTVSGGLKYFF